MVKRYKAVLFDLFGTIALFNPDKLPVFDWNGRTTRSTMGRLRDVVVQTVPSLQFEHFYHALTAVNQELGEIRTKDMREIVSAERFRRTLVRAGLDDSSETAALGESLSLAHMDLLAQATEVPASHTQFVAQTSEQYPTALVSNFDHGPTARRVIQEGQVAEYFAHIVISAEHGWRKPHRKIFTDTLVQLNVTPESALFVGDSPTDDVIGARQVGMDMAWVNASEAELPGGCPSPQYTIQSIPELASVLFPSEIAGREVFEGPKCEPCLEQYKSLLLATVEPSAEVEGWAEEVGELDRAERSHCCVRRTRLG